MLSNTGVSANSPLSASPTLGAPAAAAPKAATLGKEDFLKLLVTQLRYQDPMSPQNPTEFISQLAQFSSLEQLLNVNTSISGLEKAFKGMQTNLQMAQGVAFLGKQVRAVGNSLEVKAGLPSKASYQLSQNAQEVKVAVLDGAGRVVRTLTLGAQGAGERVLAWDGRDDQGKPVPDGRYTFQVTAKTAKGEPVSVTTYFTGTVTEVVQEQNGVRLKVGDRLLDLSSILGVTGG